ncbi:MAG: multidrug effflux MFS transporter [Hylemonella sp.]|nr:multidrug effflux MFS transporter [Hylemonella sp.]
MSPALIVLILSLLLGLQPITTDLYLPALPALTAGFGATLPQAQLTLTALLLAFGISQLVWGPLSDRFGRRPILLWGLGAYVLASVVSTLAPTMELLIVARVLQGVAMGAGVMCARAIVRDLYKPVEGARMMSKGLTGLGVIACLSGPLGGVLSGWAGWRIALLALSVFGAATLALVAWRFEETVKQKNPQALQPATLLQTWRGIVRHPTFWAYSALSAASYGGLFTVLASSSFVFIDVLGLSRPAYGFIMSSVSLTYILGTLACRRLLPRLGVRRSVALAAGFTLTGGTLMGIFALVGLHNGWAIMLPFYLFMLAHGVHQPCSQSGAVGPFPYAAGAASALNGFLMAVTSFIVGHWLGTAMDGTVLPLMYGVWFWSVMIALAAWTLVQKHGKSSEH